MHSNLGANPALTVALALVAGMLAQSLARHLRIPAIVLLLGSGVMLGPDGLDIVRPELLGDGLPMLVGFAVAIILFEGGLNLDWQRLRREGGVIRRLITLGAAVTALGGMLAAHLLLGWQWRPALLFGTLVIVTGPTVITPLLRRIKVRRNLETVLEAEGIFGDAVGAIVAVVTLEVLLAQSGDSMALGVFGLPSRLLLGLALGGAGGLAIVGLLRVRRLVPEGYENIFTLAIALALFQTSNAIIPETGIVTAIVAGLVVGNARTPVARELREFKEQLTIMMIGLLFVLLAADVRLREVAALGWPGLATALALMFLVRPLNILASTGGAGLTWREKAFLSWVAPRGIVAAAVSSLFGRSLAEAGVAGGEQLRALVFLVIALTVVAQGATTALVAGWLGVRRPSGVGYAILGAQPIGRLLGRLLGARGEPVVLIDANPDICREARQERFQVVQGNVLEETTLLASDLESRRAAIGVLPNEAVNLLFVQRARLEFKVPRCYVAMQRGHGAVGTNVLRPAGASLLFGQETDLENWSVRLRRGLAASERWLWRGGHPQPAGGQGGAVLRPPELFGACLPLVLERAAAPAPIDDATRLREGDAVHWLIFGERRDQVENWLTQRGWEPPTSAGGKA